jgi:hypothetical protein
LDCRSSSSWRMPGLNNAPSSPIGPTRQGYVTGAPSGWRRNPLRTNTGVVSGPLRRSGQLGLRRSGADRWAPAAQLPAKFGGRFSTNAWIAS